MLESIYQAVKTDKKITNININSAVIIPALNPIPSLSRIVQALLENGIPQVIIVNDGSESLFDSVFDDMKRIKNCTVLSHKGNRGKGRALKTAFSYVAEHFPYLDGVVTADADGQHAIEDICRVCKEVSLNKESLVLGVRNLKEMPKRSYLGNIISSRIFRFLYNIELEDTQTGLRGIPLNELKWMIETKGEHYDYEINMLIKAKRRNINFTPILINTLYFDNNSGTHYKVLKDSLLIFLRLILGSAQVSSFIKKSYEGK